MSGGSLRGTIQLEVAQILSHEHHAGNQHVLRVHAPRAARSAEPGSFAHITCDRSVPLRRPLSIMRADPVDGWLEFLYKPVGAGLARLADRVPGESLSVLAPIGRGFEFDASRPRIVAIGGGVGIPPMIFVAERLRGDPRFARPLVLMGSELPFPFDVCESEIDLPGMPRAATHCMLLLEQWGVPSRLASNAGLPGAYRGHVTELAREWLAAAGAAAVAETQLLACGPEPMLRAAAALARELDVPCQLALEEYMACGVGGCAGCTVRIETPDGPAMKRVCVDGPVFDSRAVYPG
ncbi:MAG: dihydroorotate dehydrogenase electron transfer subunit [Gammaproteobacteria bacterium]|nr:dihydroorotate dehydrogenase electron transfer subunit [Gammaproteobacteria bacterium]